MILNNPTILQPNIDISSTKDIILIREEQLAKLHDLDFFTNIKMVCGWPGSGKTTMTRYYLNSLEDPMKMVIYLDCKVYNTANKILAQVYNELAMQYPEINTWPDHREGIWKIIQKLDRKVYLVLDEINVQLESSKDVRKDDLLHYFLRMTSENREMMFKFIFITNVFNFEAKLSREVTSMLLSAKIVFGVYQVNEFTHIFKLRSEVCLIEGSYEEKDLAYMSKVVYNDFDSDARKGIELLNLVAKETETHVTFEIIDHCAAELRNYTVFNEIKGFPRGAQILLKAIVKDIIQKQQSLGYPDLEFSKKYANSLYLKLCKEEGYQPYEERTLIPYFRELQKQDIITFTGVTNQKDRVYRLCVDPHRLEVSLDKLVFAEKAR